MEIEENFDKIFKELSHWGGMYKSLTGGNSGGTRSRGCIDNLTCKLSCKGEQRNGETVAEIHISM